MDKQIEITAGQLRDTALAGLRILSVLVGGVVALFGFLTTRDLAGLIVWVQSEAFLPFAGALIAGYSLAYGLWRTWRTKKQLVIAASAAPNSVAVVKDATPLMCVPLFALIPAAGLVVASGFLSGCAALTPVASLPASALSAFQTAQNALRFAEILVPAACFESSSEGCRVALQKVDDARQVEALGLLAIETHDAIKLENAARRLAALPEALEPVGVSLP